MVLKGFYESAGLEAGVVKSPFVNRVILYNKDYYEIQDFGKTEFGVSSEVLFCIECLWDEAVYK